MLDVIIYLVKDSDRMNHQDLFWRSHLPSSLRLLHKILGICIV